MSVLSLVWMAGKVSSEHQADLNSRAAHCAAPVGLNVTKAGTAGHQQHIQHSAGNPVHFQLPIVQQRQPFMLTNVLKKKKIQQELFLLSG